MKYYDARDQVFESNDAVPSYDLDMLDFVLDSGFHHDQEKTRTALIPSQSAKTQASCPVAQTNIGQSTLSWQGDNNQG